MITTDFVTELATARGRMTPAAWQNLVDGVRTLGEKPDARSIKDLTARLNNRDAAWLLAEALRKQPGATWNEIAAAMVTVDHFAGDEKKGPEVIWTGPANGRFPVRRTDQVLYDLIAAAKRRIVLVTFAAHRVPHLCSHLLLAVGRGVELDLIIEWEEESEGQLTHDAAAAFQTIPADRMRLYYWPLARRERNQAGRPGKLHVKCAIVDDMALIGSANLTDDAFNRNMELGVLLRDRAMVRTIEEHFGELIRTGSLVRLRPEHD